MIIVKLMGKTGVCLNKLSKPIFENLTSKIIDMIQKRDYLNVLISWIEEISSAFIDDKNIMNFNMANNFIESVKRLGEDYGSGISP
jgi:hypothetical protein